jgi:hypothetical protein
VGLRRRERYDKEMIIKINSILTCGLGVLNREQVSCLDVLGRR